jgi:hypothetical protein
MASLGGGTYQLYKRYTNIASGRYKDRKITRPNATTFQALDAGGGTLTGTVNPETGIATITGTPATWTGRFYVPVHFQSDVIDWTLDVSGPEEFRYYSGPSVVFRGNPRVTRAISSTLKAHYALGTTTIASCWRATLRDESVIACTDYSKNLTVDGVEYLANNGFSGSDIASGSDLSVDNLEVDGFLASPLITDYDINRGRWDYAAIEIFEVNYADLTMGKNIVRSGTLGRVTAGRSQFKTELRGLSRPIHVGSCASSRRSAPPTSGMRAARSTLRRGRSRDRSLTSKTTASSRSAGARSRPTGSPVGFSLSLLAGTRACRWRSRRTRSRPVRASSSCSKRCLLRSPQPIRPARLTRLPTGAILLPLSQITSRSMRAVRSGFMRTASASSTTR